MFEQWLRFVASTLIAGTAAIVAVIVVSRIFEQIFRRLPWSAKLVTAIRAPLRSLAFILAVWLASYFNFPGTSTWWRTLDHVLTVLSMVAGGWLAVSIVMFLTGQWLGWYGEDASTPVARRIRTQARLIQRLSIAIVILITAGAVLMTFPAVRTVGASVLASAGIASIVAGLAAQTALSNLFAGIQLVFSEALRVDDVVVVEGQWGTVGEVTLTYVVINLYDERRLVLPCTYFTTQPFESWTRDRAQISGVVEFDLDWSVPVHDVRDQLSSILEETELWDGRTAVTQVTDAKEGWVRVRVMLSAENAGKLWDLRCFVRERIVTYLRYYRPESLPISRVLVGDVDTDPRPLPAERRVSEGLFTGSEAAEGRYDDFTGSLPVVEDDAEPASDPSHPSTDR